MRVFNLLAISATTAAAASVALSVPSAVPSSASPMVQKEFLGLGIESWCFVNYTGSLAKPNNFSLNMFKALSSRTGSLPIRVGGDTGDRVKYVPTQTIPILFAASATAPSATQSPSNAFDVSKYGPSFFEGLKLVPNAKWVYQVPMLANNINNSVQYMQAALDAMPSGSFSTFEMGNEPQSYNKLIWPKEFGPWGPQAYVNMWINWTTILNQSLTGLPKDKPNYWALSSVDLTSWGIKGPLDDGLGNVTNRLQAISQHYYQDSTSGGLEVLRTSYMNHSTTVKKMSQALTNVNTLKANTEPDVPLVLGETGPGGCGSVNGGPCANNLGTSFGASLWTLDFLLHGMVLGIQRINLHMVDHSYEAGWRPVEYIIDGALAQPAVQGVFYGEIFVADLLNQTKGDLQVAELPAAAAADPNLVAYSAYDSGKLNKVIVINNDFYASNSTSPRSSTSVTLSGLGSTSKVRVDRLSGTGAELNTGISWAGQQWTYENKGIPTTLRSDSSVLSVVGGKVTVPINATQAVMVSLL